MESLKKSSYKYYRVIGGKRTAKEFGLSSRAEEMVQFNAIVRATRVLSQYINCECLATGHTCSFILSDVELIDVTDNEAIKLALDADKKRIEYMKAQEATLKKVIDTEFANKADIDFVVHDFSKPQDLITLDNSFVELGTMLSGSRFVAYKTSVLFETCAYTKADSGEDMLVYLPVQWLNYAGYNESFLLQYLEFIRGLNLNVNVDYLGIGKFSAYRPQKIQAGQLKQNNIITENSFYKIQIVGSEFCHEGFMVFVLLRQLYHSSYNNLPGLAIQIKQNLGDRVSNLDALSLANYSGDYDKNFSFFPFSLRFSKYGKPAINFDMPAFFERIKINHNIDYSFPYVLLNVDENQKAKDLILKKDFEALYTFVSSFTSTTNPDRLHKRILNKPQRRGEPQQIGRILRAGDLNRPIRFNVIGQATDGDGNLLARHPNGIDFIAIAPNPAVEQAVPNLIPVNPPVPANDDEPDDELDEDDGLLPIEDEDDDAEPFDDEELEIDDEVADNEPEF